MRTRLLTISAIVILAVAGSCKKGDGNESASKFNPNEIIPADQGVDLGICEHLIWRCGNLGATNAEDFGDYYAWGETQTYYEDGDAQKLEGVTWKAGKKKGYSEDWSSYSLTTDGGETFLRYTGTDYNTLLSYDDAASELLGDRWRIPTEDEWNELVKEPNENIDKKWVKLRGKEGLLFTSKVPGCEGNFIFLPMAGFREGTTLDVTSGNYWSSTYAKHFTICAYGLYFDNHRIVLSEEDNPRFIGQSIRPVRDQAL